MPKLCLYFQVHQPYRLRKYNVFDAVNNVHNYFDDEQNARIVRSVAEKCYIPTNKMLLQLIRQYKGAFKVSFAISGLALEQFDKYCPEVIASFRALALTGCVEFIAETYNHGLSALESPTEFAAQVKRHKELIHDHFDYKPVTLRNSELLYNNTVGTLAADLGFTTVLAEGSQQVLDWRSPNYVYRVPGQDTSLLLRNSKLSDDIAYRFSNRMWQDYPLTAQKYVAWLMEQSGQIVNLFMDYETFGEHHWENTGIFHFLYELPREAFKHLDLAFMLPHESLEYIEQAEYLSVPETTSWADTERDASAWYGNAMQQAAVKRCYALEKEIKKIADARILHDWQKLGTTDHFYYMSTKTYNDGSVHSYFSPYVSPYEAFINYMNVLDNLEIRIRQHKHSLSVKPKKVSIKKVVATKVKVAQKSVTATVKKATKKIEKKVVKKAVTKAVKKVVEKTKVKVKAKVLRTVASSIKTKAVTTKKNTPKKSVAQKKTLHAVHIQKKVSRKQVDAVLRH